MKIKVNFLNDNGAEVIVTFDRDAGTVTAQDGRTGTYSRPDGGSDGRKGAVTILSIS